MKKLALSLLTTIALAGSLLVGLTALAPTSAQAATCFKTATVGGQNAYGYARTSSLSDWKAYVRTAPVANLCINYSTARGGYYFSSVSCSQSSARLTSDSTSVLSANNYVNHITYTSASCGATAKWKWHRTVAQEQCVSLNAQSRWGINQSTGAVTFNLGLSPDGYFAPGC